MCSELCKDFYVVYQLEMVAGEVESSACQLVATFFFFFFLVLPYQTIEISLGQPSPPSYQLLAPPLFISAQLVEVGRNTRLKLVSPLFARRLSIDNYKRLTARGHPVLALLSGYLYPVVVNRSHQTLPDLLFITVFSPTPRKIISV